MKRAIATSLSELTYQFDRNANASLANGGMQKMDEIGTSAKADKAEKLANLNFKVDRNFFRSFTIMAREMEMKNKAFLVELLDSFTRTNAEQIGSRSPEMQRRFAELRSRSKA